MKLTMRDEKYISGYQNRQIKGLPKEMVFTVYHTCTCLHNWPNLKHEKFDNIVTQRQKLVIFVNMCLVFPKAISH